MLVTLMAAGFQIKMVNCVVTSRGTGDWLGLVGTKVGVAGGSGCEGLRSKLHGASLVMIWYSVMFLLDSIWCPGYDLYHHDIGDL